ncbi:hypothetical protein WISP_123518 [Willisornis vidua]|uniref:Uncharacterized protein n=1 Tax=Willisornis vidua TaxID=1566151 RepID=A0ABQ9CYA4_9PASS|nr:hypothetical protein WISP_123518 [Willisornis vidua]
MLGKKGQAIGFLTTSASLAVGPEVLSPAGLADFPFLWLVNSVGHSNGMDPVIPSVPSASMHILSKSKSKPTSVSWLRFPCFLAALNVINFHGILMNQPNMLLMKMLKQIFDLEHLKNPAPTFKGQDLLDPGISEKTPMRTVCGSPLEVADVSPSLIMTSPVGDAKVHLVLQFITNSLMKLQQDCAEALEKANVSGMFSEYAKVFCALYLYYLNAFHMTVNGERIDVVDWNGWLACLCWWRRGVPLSSNCHKPTCGAMGYTGITSDSHEYPGDLVASGVVFLEDQSS